MSQMPVHQFLRFNFCAETEKAKEQKLPLYKELIPENQAVVSISANSAKSKVFQI
tara:strand:- start:562 stop:726 length:165 start_codon:yes stop_codon:yes gene_type:complete